MNGGVCESCGGTGYDDGAADTCFSCGGTGWIDDTETEVEP